ncbi:MAG: hypothetical protein ORN83_02190, partial [Chthoniobacteraceae bacterium]|nr:hypothetical protein [Chthoniobacteraceae bacterium]
LVAHYCSRGAIMIPWASVGMALSLEYGPALGAMKKTKATPKEILRIQFFLSGPCGTEERYRDGSQIFVCR